MTARMLEQPNETVLRFEVADDFDGRAWRGTVKWDGCIDLDPDSRHYCGPDELVAVARLIADLAAQHLPGWEGGRP